jgi:hypothetical protein
MKLYRIANRDRAGSFRTWYALADERGKFLGWTHSLERAAKLTDGRAGKMLRKLQRQYGDYVVMEPAA